MSPSPGIRSLLLVAALFPALAACATAPKIAPSRMPAADGEPAARAVFPATVTRGDTVQVGYYLDNRTEPGMYRIGVGDVLKIEVVDHPDLTREEATVLPDGRVSASLVGAVSVVGKTVEEAGADIAALYAAERIKEARVLIAVLKGQQRLRNFIQLLGGERGFNKLEMKVYDGYLDLPFIPPVVVGRDLEEIRREIKGAYRKEFGDQIQVTVNLVGKISTSVYVMGEVKKPGSIELAPGANVPMLIAMAGGFAETANEGEVILVRFKEDGSFDYWVFGMKDGIPAPDGGIAKFRIRGNDVVYVARSAIAKVDLFVDQYIRKVIPVNVGFGVGIPIGD